jgi:hypothetical protein
MSAPVTQINILAKNIFRAIAKYPRLMTKFGLAVRLCKVLPELSGSVKAPEKQQFSCGKCCK